MSVRSFAKTMPNPRHAPLPQSTHPVPARHGPVQQDHSFLGSLDVGFEIRHLQHELLEPSECRLKIIRIAAVGRFIASMMVRSFSAARLRNSPGCDLRKRILDCPQQQTLFQGGGCLRIGGQSFAGTDRFPHDALVISRSSLTAAA